MEDITESILDGSVPIDPVVFCDTDIEHIVIADEHQEVTELVTGKPDDSDDEDSESTAGSDYSDEEYLPSILDMSSASEISAILSRGGHFREDEEDDESTVDDKFKLTMDDLELLADYPAVQRILMKMRPEQITSELVRKLCSGTKKLQLTAVKEESEESESEEESECICNSHHTIAKFQNIDTNHFHK